MASFDVQGLPVNEGTHELMTELLADLIGTASHMGLMQTGFSPSQDSVYADFDAAKCTFDGYAAKAVTWNVLSPVRDSQGNWRLEGPAELFTCTGTTTPNVVTGVYLWVTIGGPANKVYAYALFPSPITIASVGQYIEVTADMLNTLLSCLFNVDN